LTRPSASITRSAVMPPSLPGPADTALIRTRYGAVSDCGARHQRPVSGISPRGDHHSMARYRRMMRPAPDPQELLVSSRSTYVISRSRRASVRR
jgi:hypothetical protein